MNRKIVIGAIGLLVLWITSGYAQNKNGFNLESVLIPIDLILSGGPAKDGIPSIDNPHFIDAGKVRFLSDDSLVLGLDFNGISKAYPINILNWHEVVNDRYNNESVVITFCPLCNRGMAFSAHIEGKAHTFGVSGLVYNSDVLLYDRQTESLWSQLMTQAISGVHKGKRLVSLPVLHTTWQDWKTQHPNSVVLTTETGFRRDYQNNPYAGYLDSRLIMFPVTGTNHRYHPKEIVLGLEVGGQFKAYPFIELEKSADSITEMLNGQSITIRYNHQHRSAAAFNQYGKQLPGVKTFWFAWIAFHPSTEVYRVAQ